MYSVDISFFLRRWNKTRADRLIKQITKRRRNFLSKFTKNTITQVARPEALPTGRDLSIYSISILDISILFSSVVTVVGNMWGRTDY